jgi:electron transfer flavoprotein alpha subunit
MAKILVVAEHDGKAINPSTAKTISAAATIADSSIDVLVLAETGAPVAEQAAAIESVTRVLVADDPANAHPLAAIQAPQVAAAAEGYSHVFGPSTTFGRDLMPRVAALLGVNQVSDVMAIVSEYVFQRPIYAGNAVVTVEAPAGVPVVATIRPASYPGAPGGNSAPVEPVSLAAADPGYTRFIEMQTAQSDRPDLQTASRVVAGGRALGSTENFDLIYSLADKLGAGVGATRAAVDAGYVANDLQVGQTGKIIAPELYFAIGISGAIQHMTGIKDAGTIVAINKDEEAPIFEFADIGLVGDLFSVLPELTDALG